MKTASYDFILPFFVASDELRPAMKQIHSDKNGFLYATNGHMLIKVERDSAILKYEEIEKFPNAEAMFERYNFSEKAIIRTDNLVEILSAYKWIRETETELCKKCNGTGVIECEHCNSESDCKECKGKGEFNTGISNLSLLITDNYYSVVKVINKLFKADFMHVLAICAKMLEVKEIEVSFNENEYEPHIFKVGDAQILIMPRQSGSDDFIREIKVKSN